MDKITSFLMENWIYIVGAVVLFWQNVSSFIKDNLGSALATLKSKTSIGRLDGDFVQKIIDGVKSVEDSDYKTDVVKDIDCFNWIKTRALEAGDQSLFQELENVNKKFYTSVYSTLYNPSVSTKQLPK